jgi:hypothetical protein
MESFDSYCEPRARSATDARIAANHQQNSNLASRGCWYYPKPEGAEALSSQYRVCSSVQPGTAKCVGTLTRSRGSMALRRCVRKWIADGLARCIIVALAEANNVIATPNAITERIVFAPLELPSPSLSCARERPRRQSASCFTIGQICGITRPRSGAERATRALYLTGAASRYRETAHLPAFRPEGASPTRSGRSLGRGFAELDVLREP